MAGLHKLSYFAALEGRALAIRIAFFEAGVPFVDERLSKEDFGKAKAEGKYPTGVPELVLPDGRRITQSAAIARYAGRLGSLYPKDAVSGLLVDSVIDIFNDILMKSPQDEDRAELLKKREEYAAGKLQVFLGQMETIVKSSEGPFVLGSALSIADLMIYLLNAFLTSGFFDGFPKEIPAAYPSLRAVPAAVASHPVVAAYFEATKDRPKDATSAPTLERK
eukprot:TRINITY_DN853_c0_g1_i1.p1 TRINITY_DN853_c0_g1~~TRINITY_DN853_c0_g1_i1.p1  ORF type:complete len:221 (-),score=52.01 TRINITY_DN853_c0_g1_i1:140-802(-)